jgi:hypothetical protein
MRALTLLLALAATTAASAQVPWTNLPFGVSRDTIHTRLDTANLAVSSTPDGNLQTNTDYPLILPGLLYPLPVLVTFRFDANSRLAETALSLDLASMRRDWAALGSDDALFTFAADKLALNLAGVYGPPVFNTPTCDAPTETTPCTLEWRDPTLRQQIQLERIPNGHHIHLIYLPISGSL